MPGFIVFWQGNGASQIASVMTSTGDIVEVFPDEVAMRVPLLLRWIAFGYAILTVLAQILIRAHSDVPTHTII